MLDQIERRKSNATRTYAVENLRKSNVFLDSIIENIPDMIFIKDAKELRFVRFNHAGEELLGYAREELIGKNDYDFFPREEADHFTAKDREVLAKGKLFDIPEEPIHTRHKGRRILHTKKIPLLDEYGEPQYLLGISEDITERKEAENALKKAHDELETRVQERTAELRTVNETLQRLALIDPLTELFNRRGLQQILSQQIPRLSLEESDLLALVVDLDDFKKTNDLLGHAVGDVVLSEITRTLKSAIRAKDFAARVGGDEFLILLPDTRLAEGLLVAEKLRLAISNTPVILSSGDIIKVTASMGLVPISRATPSIDELMTETSEALVKSKRSGKNQISYSPSEHTNSTGTDRMAGVLEKLRDRGRFRVVKHPIFQLDTLTEVACELLSRSTIEGFEMPDDFFRVCLENNMLTLVDHRCFRACIDMAASLPQNGRYHVNLFPSTMIDIPVSHLLQELFESNPKKNFCIEISEQQIIGDPSYLVEHVQKIKASGVLVAIDDVGFGRSCLESLVLLEPNIIKIDKRCVRGIGYDPARSRSLKRLLNVAEALGTEVIAEGIESEKDLDALREFNVKYGQGFFLDKDYSSKSR